MSVRNPNIVDGMYYGNLDERRVGAILTVRNSKEIPNLVGMVYDLPYPILNEARKRGIGAREYLKEIGEDASKYKGALRDYQTVGAGFLYTSPRSILGDGVGLGKTAEVSALLNMLYSTGELKGFLMAVESSAAEQTVQELQRFTGLNVIFLPSEKAKMTRVIKKTAWDNVDGIVIKHGGLKSNTFFNWLSLNLNDNGTFKYFNTFILDESSVIKNQKTQIYQYTRNICDRVQRVHFLNATVFETNILDIYYQVDMMNPSVLPSKSRIEAQFCKFQPKVFWKRENGSPVQQRVIELTGYKNQDEFKKSLRLFYFGRSIKDTGIKRNNEFKVFTVEPTADQMMEAKVTGRQSEILNCPTLVEGSELPFTREKCPKLDRLLTLCEQDFHDSKIMIYCMYIEAQNKIKEYLEASGRKVCILNGSTKQSLRNEYIEGFNTDKYDIIITNIKKSLNLYSGDVCIFYTIEGNPAKMEQLRGRIDRNVDNKLKTYILLLYSNTLEYILFTETAKMRSKDSKDLTIDFSTAVDYFVQSMEEDENE